MFLSPYAQHVILYVTHGIEIAVLLIVTVRVDRRRNRLVPRWAMPLAAAVAIGCLVVAMVRVGRPDSLSWTLAALGSVFVLLCYLAVKHKATYGRRGDRRQDSADDGK